MKIPQMSVRSAGVGRAKGKGLVEIAQRLPICIDTACLLAGHKGEMGSLSGFPARA